MMGDNQYKLIKLSKELAAIHLQDGDVIGVMARELYHLILELERQKKV